MRKPYIGVTDVASGAQAKRFLDHFVASGGQAIGRRLMIGVMMSRKTLWGRETKWAKVFPKNDDVAGIFIDHPLAMNTLHYVDYDDFGINDPLSFKKAITFGGLHLHAIQLDMVWPHPDSLLVLRKATGPDIEIILQIGGTAIDLMDGDDGLILKEFDHYVSSVDRVLFDWSMGTGKQMDGHRMATLVQRFAHCFPRTDITVAGGLGPYTLCLLDPVIKIAPNVSIDSQSRLRPTRNAMDPLDEDYVLKYIEESIIKFRPTR